MLTFYIHNISQRKACQRLIDKARKNLSDMGVETKEPYPLTIELERFGRPLKGKLSAVHYNPYIYEMLGVTLTFADGLLRPENEEEALSVIENSYFDALHLDWDQPELMAQLGYGTLEDHTIFDRGSVEDMKETALHPNTSEISKSVENSNEEDYLYLIHKNRLTIYAPMTFKEIYRTRLGHRGWQAEASLEEKKYYFGYC